MIDLQERKAFWRHPCFRDLALLKARFTRHRYERHTHPTYVIALITAGAERVKVGRETVIAPTGSVLVVTPRNGTTAKRDAMTAGAIAPFIRRSISCVA
jgi:hypothetical protein